MNETISQQPAFFLTASLLCGKTQQLSQLNVFIASATNVGIFLCNHHHTQSAFSKAPPPLAKNQLKPANNHHWVAVGKTHRPASVNPASHSGSNGSNGFGSDWLAVGQSDPRRGVHLRDDVERYVTQRHNTAPAE